jgi:hypothetical protein
MGRTAEVAGSAAAKADTQSAKNATKRAKRTSHNGQDNSDFGKAKPPAPQAISAAAELGGLWMKEMKKAYPDLVVASWAKKDFIQANNLIKKYGEEVVEAMCLFVIRNWESILKKWFKGTGGSAPTFGLVVSMHERISPDAQNWSRAIKALEEREAFVAANPEAFDLPGDLYDRVVKAKEIMNKLGFSHGR